MSDVVLDKIGQEIRAGSWIVYGHALGRCAGLRLGLVLEPPRIHKRDPYKSSQGNVRVTVWGVDDDWNHRKPRLLSKKSTLMFSERMIVLREELVPVTIRALFADIEVKGE